MEAWRKVWREGAVPLISTKGLQALLDALVVDDPRLLQGATTQPPPLKCVEDWPVEGCCPLSLCGWIGLELTTVAEVEEFFARLCYEIDQRVGEPAGCRHFINWWDESPRGIARLMLLDEVKLALTERKE